MKRILAGTLLVLILSVSLSGCFYGGGHYYRYGYAPPRPYYGISYSYRRPHYSYKYNYHHNRNRSYNRNHNYSHSDRRGSRYDNYSRGGRNRR
ncbi:MAG TPA: hypothetical protein VK175_19350 [Leadbetterella sp.]|nr:hypothetical protein [Leadbetterella sp.]